MKVRLFLAVCAVWTSACSDPAPEEAMPDQPSEDFTVDEQAISQEFAGSGDNAGASDDGCDGFVDGSSRPWAIAGVALGDEWQQVQAQLRCGDLRYEIRELEPRELLHTQQSSELMSATQGKIENSSGEDRIVVYFVGSDDPMRVVKIYREASFKNNNGPTIDSLVSSLKNRFPEANQSLNIEGFFKNRRADFDLFELGDGKFVPYRSSDHRAIDPNPATLCHEFGNQQRIRQRLKPCGKALALGIFQEPSNPELVRYFRVTVSNAIEFDRLLLQAVDRLEKNKESIRSIEVENAQPVKGL